MKFLPALAVVVVLVWGCDPRAFLAQSTLFEGVRQDVLQECCACLARRGTAAPGASCAEAVLSPDGGVVVGEGALVVPPNPAFSSDDLDDVVDENGDGTLDVGEELSCACAVDQNSCIGLLEAGGRITVPGACIDQPNNFFDAPCERACANVLTFDPVPTAP